MKPGPDRRAYALAIGGGVLLWVATMAVGGRREAWDSRLYWIAAYPLAIALAAWLGYRFPRRAWRWGLAIMLGQAVMLAVTSLEFGMLPLGFIVFAILALPLVAVAVLVAWSVARLERRRRPR